MASTFGENVRGFVEHACAQGRAVAVTEVGCGTDRSAGEMASRDGVNTIVWCADGRPVRPNGDFVRDEQEQVNYIREALEVFDAEAIEAAFVSFLARDDMPYRADPRLDLDMLSAGIVTRSMTTVERAACLPPLSGHAVGAQSRVRWARG